MGHYVWNIYTKENVWSDRKEGDEESQSTPVTALEAASLCDCMVCKERLLKENN